MTWIKSLFTGMGLGALLMYLYDPQRGRRRRSITRDKAVHSARSAVNGIDVAWKDLGNRVRGRIADVRLRMNGAGVPDRVLEARVRSRIGRVVSHPKSITITARDGHVRISGPILTHEVNSLLRTARAVPGVAEIEHVLDIHEHADVPSLQGGRERPGYPGALQREHWKPATRLIVGASGLMVGVYGVLQGGIRGMAARMAGGGLLLRASTNEPLRKLFGIDRRPDLIEVQKTVHLDAPPRAVFSFWDRVENFPHFMRNVLDVQDLGGGRSHWTVQGPAGAEIEWDAEVIERVENQFLAWRTTDDALVQHAGMVRFMEDGEESTRVDIHLTYTPPAGALGHVVATLFGADPKNELDSDLARMKTMIETGRIPHDAAKRDGKTFMSSRLPHAIE